MPALEPQRMVRSRGVCRFACASLLALALPATVQAELYRWIDPESGSVKYSSYPPRWLSDPAQAKRNPKVEVIKEIAPPVQSRDAIAPVDGSTASRQMGLPEPASVVSPVDGANASAISQLEAKRRALINGLLVAVRAPDFTPNRIEFRRQVEDLRQVSERLDELDPGRVEVRRREEARLVEQIKPAASGALR